MKKKNGIEERIGDQQVKNVDGTKISKILYNDLKKYLEEHPINPTIVDISIGDDFGGLMYSKMKQKKIKQETGIEFQSVHYDKISKTELIKYIKKLNSDKKINGIMLQLPLPKNLSKYEREILDTINYKKDVDGLTTISSGRLSIGIDTFVPCTALGIETLFKVYNISLEGKKVAIINRSNIVGKPLFHLMLKNNATPVICHSKTIDLKENTSNCDIVIAALNKKEYVTKDFIKKNAIVIDVGVHKNAEGKTVGDVNYDDVQNKAALITPPVGAVGPMTICMLAYNAAKSVYGEEINVLFEKSINKAKKQI